MAKTSSQLLQLLLLSPPLLTHPNPKALHAYAITTSLLSSPFAASRIIQHLLLLNLTYAVSVFNSLPFPDLYTHNAIIAAHVSSPSSSLRFFSLIRAHNLSPNSLSFGLILKSCIRTPNSGLGSTIHGQVVKCGFVDYMIIKNSLLRTYCILDRLFDARTLFEESRVLDAVSWNTMVSAYGKKGDLGSARHLFDRISERNLVSWSALIDGYVGVGDHAEAMRLFRSLRTEGIRPDSVVLVSALKACAHLNALEEGQSIHRYVDENDLASDSNVVLATALIDMYCKCGCVDNATHVFDKMPNKDVVIYNAMIAGLAMHGDSTRSLDLFTLMTKRGIKPNRSTYVSVLSACVHAGLVDAGIKVFESMKNYGIEPDRDHYGCIADMLGRAGRVRDAEQVLLSMRVPPEPTQWGALMSACIEVKDVEIGERVGRRLIELEPLDGGRWIALANLYAVAGRYREAREVRREMEEMGVRKETGCSMNV